MSPLIPVLLAGGALVAFMASGSSDSGGDSGVIHINGRKWIVEKQSQVGTVATYLVSSPPKQFGPHLKMPIFTFVQSGDSPARQLQHRYPGVPPTVYSSALDDLVVQETF